MRYSLVLAVMGGCISFQASAQSSSVGAPTFQSAQIEAPPSAEKQMLIDKFMQASGLQARLDSGSFLEHYAFVPELGWHQGRTDTTLFEALSGPVAALHSVYAQYRSVYQEAYASHINWEFTEEELRDIVAFLESPVGRHYLDGSWRMEAYTETNMEETTQALVEEAVALYRRKAAPPETTTPSD